MAKRPGKLKKNGGNGRNGKAKKNGKKGFVPFGKKKK